MVTLTIHVEDDIARELEEAARREHKSLSDLVRDLVKPKTSEVTALAAMEAKALANGYPPGWLALFGSLAEDETFAAPLRSAGRAVQGVEVG
jgi:predicted CopG family antitoxin